MKRKIWNQTTTPQTRKTGNSIRINSKSGTMTFSKDLAGILGLDTNRINFIQDEEKPEDWYIELAGENDKDAFTARFKANGDTNYKAFIFQSCPIAREILKSANIEGHTAAFMVASEPVDGLYAIITKSAKTKAA